MIFVSARPGALNRLLNAARPSFGDYIGALGQRIAVHPLVVQARYKLNALFVIFFFASARRIVTVIETLTEQVFNGALISIYKYIKGEAIER